MPEATPTSAPRPVHSSPVRASSTGLRMWARKAYKEWASMATWSLSYVLPVHNDEKSLATNVARLAEHLRQYRGSEILLVENGSTDESWRECEKLAGVQDEVPVHVFRETRAGI